MCEPIEIIEARLALPRPSRDGRGACYKCLYIRDSHKHKVCTPEAHERRPFRHFLWELARPSRQCPNDDSNDAQCQLQWRPMLHPFSAFVTITNANLSFYCAHSWQSQTHTNDTLCAFVTVTNAHQWHTLHEPSWANSLIKLKSAFVKATNGHPTKNQILNQKPLSLVCSHHN